MNKNEEAEINSIFFPISEKVVTCIKKFRQALISMEFLVVFTVLRSPSA